jgi:multicomponent Na+:H+ antiporter subunit G
MTALAAEILSWCLIAAGSAFVVIGAVGMIRMPDLFSRMQAASVAETMGAGLMLLGFMVQAGWSLVTLKLLFLLALIFFIGPVISHALAQAALHEGVKPLLAEDRRGRLAQKTGKPEGEGR